MTVLGPSGNHLAEVTNAETGYGVPAVVTLFAATHVSTLPAAGLHAPTDEMPAAWWVWELGSHVVYGLTVDLVRRGGRKRLG